MKKNQQNYKAKYKIVENICRPCSQIFFLSEYRRNSQNSTEK